MEQNRTKCGIYLFVPDPNFISVKKQFPGGIQVTVTVPGAGTETQAHFSPKNLDDLHAWLHLPNQPVILREVDQSHTALLDRSCVTFFYLQTPSSVCHCPHQQASRKLPLCPPRKCQGQTEQATHIHHSLQNGFFSAVSKNAFIIGGSLSIK